MMKRNKGFAVIILLISLIQASHAISNNKSLLVSIAFKDPNNSDNMIIVANNNSLDNKLIRQYITVGEEVILENWHTTPKLSSFTGLSQKSAENDTKKSEVHYGAIQFGDEVTGDSIMLLTSWEENKIRLEFILININKQGEQVNTQKIKNVVLMPLNTWVNIVPSSSNYVINKKVIITKSLASDLAKQAVWIKFEVPA